MLTKADKWKARCIVALIALIVFVLLSIANYSVISKWSPPAETQTGIEVRATVGIPAENKLGGIEFEVSDRWGYDENDRIIFFAYFDQGLELNRVICHIYHNGKYMKRDYREGQATWITWLGRFQEVLVEVTVGEKNTDMLDPNAISVE